MQEGGNGMSVRIVETKPDDRIVIVNRNHLLKFIGWVEAHRPPGDWEPGFLGQCLSALDAATDGVALDMPVTCGGCGVQHDLRMFYDFDAGGWFCSNDDECNQRRMGGAA
jgi:hypothetical protein